MTMIYPWRPSKDECKSTDTVEPTAAEQPQQQRIESAAANQISSSKSNQQQQQQLPSKQKTTGASALRTSAEDSLTVKRTSWRMLFSKRYSAKRAVRTLFSERYSAKNTVCKSSDDERQNADVVHVLTPNANTVCVLAILTSKVVESNSIKHN